MDEIGVMNLIEELSALIEDSKPVFGKNTMRQVDAQAAFEILDEIRDTFPSEFAQARQIIRERQALLHRERTGDRAHFPAAGRYHHG